jgi:hypothetical protein
MIDLFMDRMAALLVGVDIIKGAEADLSLVIEAANEIVRISAGEIGSAGMEEIFEVFHPDGSYPAIFTIGSGNTVRDIKGDPIEALEALIQVIFSFSSEEQHQKLESHFRICLEEKGLPTFDLMQNVEDPALDGLELS